MKVWQTLLLVGLVCGAGASKATAQTRPPGELAWAIRYYPRTLDPAKVEDQGAELVRYLTAGVLVRLDRYNLQVRPELASAATVSPDGRVVTFKLRPGLRFSDGAALSSADVAWSLRRVLDPAIGAPVAEEFLDAKAIKVDTPDAATIRVSLPQRVVGILEVFDEIAIEPANRVTEGRVTSGPFIVSERQPGQFVKLARNNYYWKHDDAGHRLPYASGIRLDVLTNREQEIARFTRGEYDLIDGLPPDDFALLAQRMPGAPRDTGAGLNTEQMWFNQAPGAPLADHEKAWFSSTAFRVAVAEAIKRADLARVAYDGHATPAYGFISPANTVWHDKALRVPPENPAQAARLLAEAGFTERNNQLFDAGGHAVKFSILTNVGNLARAKMAALIQQDLAALGMQVAIVTLDFPALIERLMKTQAYEACLLGHPDTDPDPNSMRNELLSSSPNHQWNPSQKTPATTWEAEIDREMNAQASTNDLRQRQQAINHVQQIVADQQPFIYLVHPDALYAVSPHLIGVAPAVLAPGLVWNIELLHREANGR